MIDDTKTSEFFKNSEVWKTCGESKSKAEGKSACEEKVSDKSEAYKVPEGEKEEVEQTVP